MRLSIVLSMQPTSFSALAYKGQLEKNIAKIKNLGYDGVELAVRDPNLVNLEKISKIIDEYGLTVPAIGTGQAYREEGLSFTDPDTSIREKSIQRIKDQINFASHFQAIVIIGLIRGKVQRDVDRNQAMKWFELALIKCMDLADKKGVKLVIEPINRYETDLVNTVVECLELINKIGNENIGLLFDTFHANIEEVSIEESIRKASNSLFHFHVADSNRWAPGYGHLDFGKIINVLKKIEYGSFLSAEILPLPDPESCVQNNIRHLRRWL